MAMKYFYENDNNEQVGPIDIAKLKTVNIKSSTLIWKEGMENWSEAKYFEELKELLIKPPPLPSKNNEVKIPEKKPVKNTPKIKQKKHGFWSYKGRMRRSEYFLNSLILGLLMKGIIYQLDHSFDELTQFLALLIVPILYFYIIVAIKRLHDLNFYGWFFFISFIPGINLILLFSDGTEGPNRYGPDPKGRQAKN